MPRRRCYWARDQTLQQNQLGAIPSSFYMGYQGNNGTYVELDISKTEQELRQDFMSFVWRKYNIQLQQGAVYSFYYINHEGINVMIPVYSVLEAVQRARYLFRGQTTAYLYSDQFSSSLYNLKEETLFKNEA